MMRAMVAFLGILALPVSAQTVQQFCDVLASNAQNMYNDVNSQEFANGMVTHDELATRYAGASSQVGFDLILMQRDILDQIIANRGKVTPQDVNNYIYRRCENDYRRIYR